eukprot:363132-Chlamydomonas_euryale.AAC.25
MSDPYAGLYGAPKGAHSVPCRLHADAVAHITCMFAGRSQAMAGRSVRATTIVGMIDDVMIGTGIGTEIGTGIATGGTTGGGTTGIATRGETVPAPGSDVATDRAAGRLLARTPVPGRTARPSSRCGTCSERWRDGRRSHGAGGLGWSAAAAKQCRWDCGEAPCGRWADTR